MNSFNDIALYVFLHYLLPILLVSVFSQKLLRAVVWVCEYARIIYLRYKDIKWRS